jgi:hypothetical protein
MGAAREMYSRDLTVCSNEKNKSFTSLKKTAPFKDDTQLFELREVKNLSGTVVWLAIDAAVDFDACAPHAEANVTPPHQAAVVRCEP